ncbi:unnamed protein product [Closterium sp. NIES-53]
MTYFNEPTSRAARQAAPLPITRPERVAVSARRTGAPLPCFPSFSPPTSSSLSYFVCRSLGSGGRDAEGCDREVWGNVGSCRGVDAVTPAAPVARQTVAPVACEPVAPVARESVAPAARLATEPVTPVAHVPVAPFASVPVAPVARVPAASAATHHLLSSHGPSSSSLALSFLRCAWCTTSGGVLLLPRAPPLAARSPPLLPRAPPLAQHRPAVRLQLRERFCQDPPVLRPYSNKGDEFSSDLLRDICRGEGILQSITLPVSPQQNGIAERRIGLVMEVARTSMIHADAPHFLWPFAVQYAAHQLNLWPRVSLPETSPTLRWTGKVGDASVFRFYHPTLRRVFSSQNVTFDESVPFYCLFPYHSAPPPPPPLFLAPGPPPVDPLPPQGLAPLGVSRVDPLPGTVPVEVAINSGAARGAASGGAEPAHAEPGSAEPEGAGCGGAGSGGAEPGGAELGGAEPAGAEPGRAESEGVEPWGAEFEGAESGGAEPRGTASSGGPVGASPRLSPRPEPLSSQQLREWFAQRTRLRSGAARAGDSAAGDIGAGGVGAIRLGGAGVTAGAGGTKGTAAAAGVGDLDAGGAGTRGTVAGGAGAGGGGARGAGAGDPAEPGGARAGGARAGGTGTGGAGAEGAGAGDTAAIDPRAGGAGAGGAVSGSTGAGGTVRPQPFFVPLLRHALSCPLPAPSPYGEQTYSFIEHREPESRLALPVCAARTCQWVPRPRPPPVPDTHVMALRPSSVPLRVPLQPPPTSSLLAVPDPESDLARAPSPTVSRLLATVVTDPSFESTAVSALIAELVDYAAACRLDYATALVAESESASPPSVGGECALGTDILEDKQKDFECLAAAETEALALAKLELKKRHTCTDLGPSALRLQVLLATVHSSAYWSLPLSSTFGQVPSQCTFRCLPEAT